jgi:hypothetical protein
METKRVKAEIVGLENRQKKFWKNAKKAINKIKLLTAIILDLIDFAIAWIPIVNEIWDIACFLILLLILKNKKLAFISLAELPLLGLPPFSIIDMFLPICTITVLIDNQEGDFIRAHHKF